VSDVGAEADRKARVALMFTEMASTYGAGADLFADFGRDLVATAAIQPGERVLDLACGRGACLRPASEAVGAAGHVLGLDLSPTMVELTADELRRDNVANAEVRVGDAEHLDLADESFDVVTCGFGVFLFPSPSVALAESRRVLRVGGRYAASTFTDGLNDYPWLPEVVGAFGLLEKMRDRSAQTGPLLRSDGLSQLLTDAGFAPAETMASERRFVFGDVDAYLVWVRSHAFGPLLSGLSEREFRRFREMCTQRLQDHRVADGYEFIKRVDITVAHCSERAAVEGAG
jgi:ubiquinone/menaquinone biosynthesis C-methylase UbiE